MIEALIGVITGIAAMLLRDTFIKGKNQQKIDSMQKQIINLEDHWDDYTELMNESISSLKQSNESKDQRINAMTRDHLKIEQSIGELNKNIGMNNQAIASLDATLQGVNNLLKHIIDGKLKIA